MTSLAALSVLLLTMVGSSTLPTAAAGKVHTVVWNGNINNGDNPLKGKKGDKVRFVWARGVHNVVELPGPTSFKKCVFLRGKSKVLSPARPRGAITTGALSSGTHYFTSSLQGGLQCKQGLKFAVYTP